tara:strand:+ start:68 stop:229 length:162 start_codon:yes stop_codon:yes gene_type:complete
MTLEQRSVVEWKLKNGLKKIDIFIKHPLPSRPFPKSRKGTREDGALTIPKIPK